MLANNVNLAGVVLERGQFDTVSRIAMSSGRTLSYNRTNIIADVLTRSMNISTIMLSRAMDLSDVLQDVWNPKLKQTCVNVSSLMPI